MTCSVQLVRDNYLTRKGGPLSQLRIAPLNLRIVSRNPSVKGRLLRESTAPNSQPSPAQPETSRKLSPLETKCQKLSALNPRLADVIELLVDDMLDELEGRTP